MKKGLTRFVCAALTAAMMAACVPCTDFGFISPKLVQAASEIGITESQGWLESAWVEWKPATTSGVSYYTVSYSKDGSSYTRIDDQLIRMYKDGHWRADVVGIAAGSYTLKVEAFNSSRSAIASETASVTVSAHDRTGFTFSPKSKTYDSSDPLQCGGYKGDGTPKADAEILYITKAADIDTVTDSTGTTGLSTILQGRDKRTTKPLIVRIIGKISYSGGELNSSGYIQVKPSKAYTNYNVTIEGIGEDATINFGILTRNAGNVEIRNLAVHDFGDDGISLDTDNTNIWLHNNEFFYGEQGSGDKAKGDGSTDVKGNSQWVTLSYNHYWDAGKCSLCGMTSESGDNYITYHHNWFDHSDSRHPRIRTMFVHVFNNYYDGNAKYGVGAAKDSSAFVEGNYFRNCKHPMLASLQGSDIMENEKTGAPDFSADGTFSGENGGIIKAYNNHIEGSDTNKLTGGVEPVYYDAADTSTNGAATQFDAYLASSRDEQVPSTVKALVGGKTFDNSNVDSYILSLTPQEPEAAKTTVEKYAGRTGGGDFAAATGFAFTNSADDSNYDINSTLRANLTSYCSDSLSSDRVIANIGGSVDGSIVPVEPTESTQTTTQTTTETTTETTTSGDSTTETTTNAPVSSLKPLTANTYDAAAISSDTESFKLTNNKGTNGQIKIDESGSAAFAVNEGADVTITYKCGSSNSSKSSGIVCAGKSSEVLAGGSAESTLTLTGLSAGEYTITAVQNGGTTAQIVNIIVSYGSVEEGIWGDADLSGTLTANDSAVILMHTLDPGKTNLSETTIKYCDVDANGTVTSNDAALVLQKTLNSEIVFPAAQK